MIRIWFKLNYKRNENYYSTTTTTKKTWSYGKIWKIECSTQYVSHFQKKEKINLKRKICTSKQSNSNNNVYMYHYHHHCGGFGTFKGLSDTRGNLNFVILLRVNSPDIKPAAVCLNRLGTCGGGLR